MEELYSLDTDALRERLLAGAGNGWPSLKDAIAFAEKHHAGQLRKGVEEPFVNHLLRTALILLEVAEQRDANVLCSGVLHDVVEDTPATLDDVEDQFGHKVGDMVRALSEPDRNEGETEHARNLRWFESMRWEGRDVHVVKSADRLDNIRTMEGAFDADRRVTYLSETRDALLPLTLSANTALYHALDQALLAEEAKS